jgi:MarR family transcriptional regulator, 2-MHQ and catechol-resistance regulon repressor
MPNSFPGQADEVLALNTFVKLMRAGDSVLSRVHRHLHEWQLTVSQFGVLEALMHLGAMSQKELAGKILCSSGNLTMVIGNLEKRGLVSRQRSAIDQRVFLVHLTPAGVCLMNEIFPKHVEVIKQEFSILTADEKVSLGKLCKILGRQERGHSF